MYLNLFFHLKKKKKKKKKNRMNECDRKKERKKIT